MDFSSPQLLTFYVNFRILILDRSQLSVKIGLKLANKLKIRLRMISRWVDVPSDIRRSLSHEEHFLKQLL